VGGMKQASLQCTESKQVILATYAMAAEALDIKTLSTLVMITPKTDIIQSVGRILRIKHENPIIVDIVDSHEVFRNQWTQRKRFYKKCNYRIRQIDCAKYKGMKLDWITDNTWTRVYEPKILTSDSGVAASGSGQEDDRHNSDDEREFKNKKCLIDISTLDFDSA
jgi:superfamily II DNA or RNA helicase